MHKGKRRPAALLALVMLLSLVLTGCGKEEEAAQPDAVAEAIFEMVIHNDAAELTQVMGYGSDEEARQEIMGSGEDIYAAMTDAMVSEFESAGATISSEDAQALTDAILTMLGKLEFTAEVKEMDEKAGTAVVTARIGCYDSDAISNAMENAMSEIMADSELANSEDTDAIYSVLFQKLAGAMSSLEPSGETVSFDVDFELSKVTAGGSTKAAWVPVDAEQFGNDLSTYAMGG